MRNENWIAIPIDFADDPKLYALSDALKIDVCRAAGMIALIWMWMMNKAPEMGFVERVSPQGLHRICLSPDDISPHRLLVALRECDIIHWEGISQTLSVPDWRITQVAPLTVAAKKRADRERKRKKRAQS